MNEYYKRIFVEGKIVKLSRYLMEQKLGRKLNSNEYVHHIDGDKFNDSINNLEVVSPVNHYWKHIETGDYKVFGGVRGQKLRKICKENSNLVWCQGCKTFINKENFTKNSSNWSGLSKRCKACQKAYRIRQKEKV